MHRLHEIGLSDIAAGTVYPALSRLERERRLTARLVASTEGPARKYYRPTEAGYQALAAGTAAWAALADLVSQQLSRPVPPAPKGR